MKTEWMNLDRFVHTKPLLFFYIIANLTGLFLYFIFVDDICNFAKTEQRGFYDFGDSLQYIFTGLPVLLLCLLINILWGIKALINIFRRRDYHAFVVGVVIAALWAANFWFCSYLANSAIKNGVDPQ
jgi:hypothetical protein